MKQQLSIDSKNITLKATHYKQSGDTCVVFVHGWTSGQYRLEYLVDKISIITDCLIFDMRGHGETGSDRSNFTISDYYQDVRAVIEYTKAILGYSKIILIGSSFGGYLSCLATGDFDIEKLVLLVPADYPDSQFDQIKEGSMDNIQWRSTVKSAGETASMRALAKYKNPVLIVEAENDEKVPRQVLLDYKASISPENVKYIILKNASHAFARDTVYLDEVFGYISTWIKCT